MLNEERVKLMTRLALLRQQECRSLEINQSRRRDYLWLNILRAVVCFTLAAVIMAVISLLCLLMQPGAWGLQQMLFYGVIVLVLYVAGVALVVLLTYVISDSRYERANEKVHQYETMLKRLRWLYEKENRK